MSNKIFSLVVGDDIYPLESLREALRDVEVDTAAVTSCEKAARLIVQTEPTLIFTAKMVSDGSWLEIVSLVEKSGVPANVILVVKEPDVGLYLNCIERGVYDFVVPPFEKAPLSHIVRSAWLDVQKRRTDLARLEVA